MEKIYVLDTSVLTYHPMSFKNFNDNIVILPISILEELDKVKKFYDEAGKNARVFLRTLDKIIDKSNGEIHKGIVIENNITLKIETNIKNQDSLGSPLYGDNRILSCCLALIKENKNKKICLVSKDIALRVRARAYGISSCDYLKDKFNVNELSATHNTIILNDNEIEEFYKQNKIILSKDRIEKEQIYANNLVSLKDKSNNILEQTRFNSLTNELLPLKKIKSIFGVVPRSIEQLFALNVLLDNDVKLVMLSGSSGTGKTLLALAVGLYSLLELSPKKYEKLIIIKPIQSVDKGIGALPGTKEEKLAPYIASLKDNLDFLMKNSFKSNKGKAGSKNFDTNIDPYFSLMLEKGSIEIEAISYLRGRSLPNAFIIVDEIQNATLHELKTILTRIGEGSKIVITGDLLQIDNMSLDSSNNALIHAMEKFKSYQLAGSIILTKGERSELATLAAEIL